MPDYSMPAVIPPRRPGDQRDGKRPALAATPPSTPSPPRSPPPSPPVRSRSPRDPPPPPGRARGRGLLPPRTLAFLTIVGLISPVSPATPPLGTPTSSCPAAYFIPTAAATSLRSDALAIAQPTPAVTLPPGPPTLAVTPPPAGDAARSDANALGTPQPTPAVISPIAPPLPTWTTLWLLLPSQTKRTPLGALTLSLGRQCQTLAVTMSASAACLLLHHHRHTRRRRAAAATTVQAALRGRLARSARRNILSVCDELAAVRTNYQRSDVPPIEFESTLNPGRCYFLDVTGPCYAMDVWYAEGDEGWHVDARRCLADHRAALAAAARTVQAHARRWFVRRSLLPVATLQLWIAHVLSPGNSILDPKTPIAVADLCLRRVEGGLSWAYCERRFGEPVADALSPTPTPRPVRTSSHASSARHRARQAQALQCELDAWKGACRLRHQRRLVLWHGRLYRPDLSRRNTARYDLAVDVALGATDVLVEGLRCGAGDDVDDCDPTGSDSDFDTDSDLGADSIEEGA